jgi:formylglycine-generating enzyme required for sulfatase activity
VGPFWIARTETTWELYDEFAIKAPDGDTAADAVTRPSRTYVPPDRGFGHEGYAAISISCRGAENYCQWLSTKTGRRYRLPTEAEWRLVCERAAIPAGEIDAFAWSAENADHAPHPVASRRRDRLGLHDLLGNVMEWCTALDGSPVALGGSFRQDSAALGCAARAVQTPDWQVTDPQVPKSSWWLSDADFMGFRVVCVPGEG